MRFVLCAFWFAACASARHGWIEDQVHLAAAEQRPLVVEFHARWCEPCKQFEHTVLPDPRVQQSLATVHFVSYDADSSAGKDAMARCAVNSFPTFLVIDGNGNIKMKKVGSGGGVDEFLRFLELARTQVGAPSAAR